LTQEASKNCYLRLAFSLPSINVNILIQNNVVNDADFVDELAFNLFFKLLNLLTFLFSLAV
jgi:hypothetical protein